MLPTYRLSYTLWLVAFFFWSFHVDFFRRNYCSSNNSRLNTGSLRYIHMPVLPIRTHPIPTILVVDVAVRKSHFVLLCRYERPQPSKQWVQFSTTFLSVVYASSWFRILKQRGILQKNYIWYVGPPSYCLPLFTPFKNRSRQSKQVWRFSNHPINTQSKIPSASHMRN